MCHSPAEGGVPEGAPEGCRWWEPPHALAGLLCGRRGAPEGCAIALPRGCAGGGVPEGCRCWKPPHALGGLLCGRRDAPEACALALPRGCSRMGCRCWEPPHALGGLLCGRRGAPEGCAITLPRGCAGGGVPEGAAVGNRRMPWEVSKVGGSGCCLDVGADWLSTWEPSHLVWWLLERSPEEGAGSVYRWYGGFQRWCS